MNRRGECSPRSFPFPWIPGARRLAPGRAGNRERTLAVHVHIRDAARVVRVGSQVAAVVTAAGTQSAACGEIRPPIAVAVMATNEEHKPAADRPRDVAAGAASPGLRARADFPTRPSVGLIARANLAAGLGRALEFSGASAVGCPKRTAGLAAHREAPRHGVAGITFGPTGPQGGTFRIDGIDAQVPPTGVTGRRKACGRLG